MFVRESIQRMNSELRRYRNLQSKNITNLNFVTGFGMKILEEGQYFGEKNNDYTLVGEITIPEDWKGQAMSLELFTSNTESDNTTNPQMKIYLDDVLIQGIDVNHREMILPSHYLEKTTINLRIELVSGREEKKYPLTVRLNLIDELSRQTYYDFYVALESWRAVLEEPDSCLIYERVLKKASTYLNFSSPQSEGYYEGLKKARAILADELYRSEFSQYQPTVEWLDIHILI